MISWYANILFFICCLFSLNTLKANGINIEVSQSIFITEANKVLTFSVKITSTSTNSQLLRPQLDLPTSWKPITILSEFELAAGASVIELVSLKIPAYTLAENYLLDFKVLSTQNKPLASKTLKVSILAKHTIVIKPLQGPDFIDAGEDARATFLVINHGNIDEFVKLTSRNCTLVNALRLELAPQQSAVIEVKINTLEELTQPTRLSYALEVNVQNKIISQQYQHVNVIPHRIVQEVDYQHLQGYGQLTYLGRSLQQNPYSSAYQGELFINGHLDTLETQYVELKLRGPNRLDGSILGLQDEYYLKFNTPDYNIHLGDQNFFLSPMTEYGRYARGVEANYNLGASQVGAFYQRPRFFPDIELETGAYYRFYNQKEDEFGFNFLNKQFRTEQDHANLLSFSTQINRIKNTSITTDIAYDMAQAWGFFTNINSRPIKRLLLNTTLLYAAPNFQGYYNDTQNLSGTLQFQLTPRIALNGNLSQDARNVAQDTLLNLAPITNRWQVGTVFRIGRKTRLQVFYQEQELEDRLEAKRFHRSESIGRIFLSQNFKKLNWTILNEFGEARDLKLPVDTDPNRILRSLLDLQYQPNYRYSLRAFTQYFYEQSDGIREQQLIYGISAQATLRRNTFLRVSAQNNFRAEEYYRDRNFFELSFRQRFLQQHTFSIDSRYALLRGSLNSRDFSLAVRYQYNFNLPLEKRTKRGDLSIQLTNNGVEEISGIVLNMNGRSVITNAEGKAVFRNISAGEHYLLIDPTSLNSGELTTKKLPLLVKMPVGIDTSIYLGIAKVASIQGRILLEEGESERKISLHQQTELPFRNTLIELIRGEEKILQLTDENGTFKVTNLRAGNWKLRVIPNQNLENISFDKSIFEFDLQAGQVKELNISAKPKSRRIRFQENMNLSIESGSGE